MKRMGNINSVLHMSGTTRGLAVSLVTSLIMCLIINLTISNPAQAALYKWVGPNGEITYSDMAPPQNATKLETKIFASDDAGTNTSLPYELANAAQNNPVILYASSSCLPCDEGRTFLKNGGIPFSEKTVMNNDDIKKLKEAGGDTQLPLLLIGSTKLHGFNAGDWRANLSNAAYPLANKLPKEYHYPAPVPAAPVVPAAPATIKKQPEIKLNNTPATPPPVRDPNGIQF